MRVEESAPTVTRMLRIITEWPPKHYPHGLRDQANLASLLVQGHQQSLGSGFGLLPDLGGYERQKIVNAT